MSSKAGINRGRLARTLTLIVFVTAVFLFVLADRLSTQGDLFQIGVVAIGAVAVVTAIVGFLVAAGAAFDEPSDRS
jgi:hypothetical protein